MTFLELSAEVRTLIYSFAKEEDKDALWVTCRQIHADLGENTDYKIDKLRRILLSQGIYFAHNGPEKEFCFSFLFKLSLTQLKEKKIVELAKTYDRLVNCKNEINAHSQERQRVFPPIVLSPNDGKKLLDYFISRKYGSFNDRIDVTKIFENKEDEMQYFTLCASNIWRVYDVQTAWSFLESMKKGFEENQQFLDFFNFFSKTIFSSYSDSKVRASTPDQVVPTIEKHLESTDVNELEILIQLYSNFEESLTLLHSQCIDEDQKTSIANYLSTYQFLIKNNFPIEHIKKIISTIEDLEVKQTVYIQFFQDVARSENTELYEDLMKKPMFTAEEMEMGEEFDQYRQKHAILKKYTYTPASIKDQNIYAICTSLFEEIKPLPAFMRADILTALYVRTFS